MPNLALNEKTVGRKRTKSQNATVLGGVFGARHVTPVRRTYRTECKSVKKKPRNEPDLQQLTQVRVAVVSMLRLVNQDGAFVGMRQHDNIPIINCFLHLSHLVSVLISQARFISLTFRLRGWHTVNISSHRLLNLDLLRRNVNLV